MIEQRRNLELFYINDTVEGQNRILRHINDFIIVVFKILCKHADTQVKSFFFKTNQIYSIKLLQSIIEPPTDFIQRLQYVSDLVLKTINEDVSVSSLSLSSNHI